MDSWPVIDLKDGDEVVFAAVAEDDDRLVFISSDSSLLTFEAKNVRPQGRTAGGMAGIKLAEGARVAAFNVVPAGKVAWTYEEGENGLTSGSGAVVLTVAGDSDALPGTENGAAKVTPLEMYPTKGRATGGVRSQRFLKGQNTLILAWVGLYPLHASTSAGSPVELPKPDMRRDGSGVDRLPHRLHCVTSIKLPLMGRAVKQTPQWGVCRRGANDSEPNNREETLNPAYTKH